MKAAAKAGHPIKAVICLHLDERIVWQRFEDSQRNLHQSRGKRHDDAADKIETRLEEFRIKTMPVIEFYKSIGMVIDIDSDHPIADVHDTIMSSLARLAGKISD
jgi:adenylate kinase